MTSLKTAKTLILLSDFTSARNSLNTLAFHLKDFEAADDSKALDILNSRIYDLHNSIITFQGYFNSTLDQE